MKSDLSKQVHEVVRPVETVVYVDQTISEALQNLRDKKLDNNVVYIYVVDREHKLHGVVPTRMLLLKDSSTPIASIMHRSIISLKGSDTLDKALKILEDQKLLALPVVDDTGVFKGCIDVDHYLDEVVDFASTRRRNDVFQMIGVYVEEGKRLPFWQQYMHRMPWMFCNMIGGLTCAVISRVFEVVLERALVLAMFIPLVLTLAESISMQSMTQTLEHIRNRSRPYKRIIRESLVVLLISITSAVVIGLLSLLWEEGHLPALTIGLGIFISIYISSLLGSFIPFVLLAGKRDPKLASGPVVLTITDVITTTIYLSLGSALIL